MFSKLFKLWVLLIFSLLSLFTVSNFRSSFYGEFFKFVIKLVDSNLRSGDLISLLSLFYLLFRLLELFVGLLSLVFRFWFTFEDNSLLCDNLLRLSLFARFNIDIWLLGDIEFILSKLVSKLCSLWFLLLLFWWSYLDASYSLS